MDRHTCFARTEKGRDELLGDSRALKPRQRQVLFLVGEAVTVEELKAKLPACQELENILRQLWEGGYVGQVKSAWASKALSPPTRPGLSPLEEAREVALRTVATLTGEQSPLYAQIKAAQDAAALAQAVASGKKILAAVASAHQAQMLEQAVLSVLKLPSSDAGMVNGIACAKGRALEIICSLVGDRSPVYIKVNGAHSRADFLNAVNFGKKVIAAVASTSHARKFEAEILSLLEDH